MTTEEMGTHILYIRKSVDELKASETKQWQYLNRHGQELAVLKNHDEERTQKARRSGFGGGLLSGAIVGFIGQFIGGFFKGWFNSKV